MNFQLETGGGEWGGVSAADSVGFPLMEKSCLPLTFPTTVPKKEKNKQHKYQEKLLSLKYTDEELQKCPGCENSSRTTSGCSQNAFKAVRS